jgi:hypothetical protein
MSRAPLHIPKSFPGGDHLPCSDEHGSAINDGIMTLVAQRDSLVGPHTLASVLTNQ